MWKTQSVLDHFPFFRFMQHINTVFPTGVMQVSKDRHTWTCSICPAAGDLSGNKFHRQNCFKYFRSAAHCDVAAARTQNSQATTAVASGIKTTKFARIRRKPCTNNSRRRYRFSCEKIFITDLCFNHTQRCLSSSCCMSRIKYFDNRRDNDSQKSFSKGRDTYNTAADVH